MNIIIKENKIYFLYHNLNDIFNCKKSFMLVFSKKYKLNENIKKVTCDKELGVGYIYFDYKAKSVGNISFDEFDIIADYDDYNNIIGLELLSIDKDLGFFMHEFQDIK